MIRDKKGSGRSLTALGIALVAMLSMSALAVGSAQAASWHVNKLPLQGSKEFAVSHPGLFEVEVPEKNLRVSCNSTEHGLIFNLTQIEYEVGLSGCTTYSLKTSKVVPCSQASPISITYKGTGESVNDSEGFILKYSGASCPLPEKTLIYIPSLSLSYAYKEAWWMPVKGAGTGAFNGSLAYATSSHELAIPEGGIFSWGWY